MPESTIVAALMAVIAERKACGSAERSYVATLLQGGDPKVLGKIAEEAAEVVAAAAEPGEAGRSHLVREAADLIFHALVLLGRHDVAWPDVEAELARRFGIGGLDEKAARSPGS